MRRFFEDEGDEFRDEVDRMFGDDDDDDNEGHMEGDYHGEIVQMLQLDMVEYDLNLRLLSLSIKMAEKSFCWRFFSVNTKLKRIKSIYHAFDALIQIHPEDQNDADLHI